MIGVKMVGWRGCVERTYAFLSVRPGTDGENKLPLWTIKTIYPSVMTINQSINQTVNDHNTRQIIYGCLGLRGNIGTV